MPAVMARFSTTLPAPTMWPLASLRWQAIPATSFNTAVGARALLANTTGLENTAIGFQLLLSNTDGHDNTAIGSDALSINISGNGNTAVGLSAMVQQHKRTKTPPSVSGPATKLPAITTFVSAGSGRRCRGKQHDPHWRQLAGWAGGLGLPHRRHFQPSDRPRDRSTDRNRRQWKIGHRRVVPRRFKRDIEPMDKVSEAILSFQPVEFHYNKGHKTHPVFWLNR